jgi:hypothetical protein
MKSQYLIVAGVHKAGTTSLYSYLNAHPDIYCSLKKEIHFFTPMVYGKDLPPFENYTKYFRFMKNEKYKLDASPSYFYGKQNIIESLHKTLQNPKIIVILREPVARFYSFYKQAKQMNQMEKRENFTIFYQKSLAEFNNYIKDNSIDSNYYNRALREGCYSLYIKEWIKFFGKNLKIIFFEDLILSPNDIMKEITQWLGIENLYEKYVFKKENVSRKPNFFLLHKLANQIFFTFEIAIRKRPALKRMLKTFYSKLNMSEFENEMTPLIKGQLQSFYRVYNKELHDILKSQNIKIPDRYLEY